MDVWGMNRAASSMMRLHTLLIISTAVSVSLQDAPKKLNFTRVVEHSHSLDVFWTPFDSESASTGTLRLRVIPSPQLGEVEEEKMVFWLASTAGFFTVSCLEPDLLFNLQLVFYLNSNGSTKSDMLSVRTKPEYLFVELWKQGKYVLIGAGIMSFVILTTAGLIFCCCRLCPCCSRRRGQMELTDRKHPSLPSVEELDNHARYTTRTLRRPPSTPQENAPPPPSFAAATRGRLDPPRFVGEYGSCGEDLENYQNMCFGTMNASHQDYRDQNDAHVYGNCQF